LISKRHRKIIELVEDNKILTMKELAEFFNVSEMTIRRDMSELAAIGQVMIMNGRISKVTKYTYDHFFGSTLKLNKTEKERITDHALNLITNGSTIFLDGTTTTNYLIKKLSKFSNLTTITNSIINLKELLLIKDLNVISIGGTINNDYQAVGPHAIENIKSFYTDLFFFGAPSIHPERGIFDSNIEHVEVKRAMIKNSIKNILMIDHTKFGRINLIKLIDINKVDLIITDSNIDPKILKELKKRNINIDVV
jgi:DeoR/GlpR family transcriptional regulator of sugar metabolism